MIIRNGIKSNLRARGRTALFFCLILVLSVTMTLGLGLRSYCENALSQCDNAYTSVAVFEFMGAEYPDVNEPDGFARAALAELDDTAIAAVPGVEFWERTDKTTAYADGLILRDTGIDTYDNAVIVVSDVWRPMEGRYNNEYLWGGVTYGKECGTIYIGGLIVKNVYSYENKDNVLTNVLTGSTDFRPQRNKKYILHGKFTSMTSGIRSFLILPFADSRELPYREISGYDDPAITSGVFAEYAEKYRIQNNAITLQKSGDISSLICFQQGYTVLTQGRFPEKGEKNACAVSGLIAENLGCGIGDTVRVKQLISADDNRYEVTAEGEYAELTVTGITDNSKEYGSYIWVAEADTQESPFFGYELGRARLDNYTAVEAVEKLTELAPDRVRVTLFDQGYASAVAPLKALERTSYIMIAACALCIITVLVLFAYLFVGRQRETVQTLGSLGAGKAETALWLLSGAGVITLPAAVAGAVAGGFLINKAIELALYLMESLYYSADKYSDTAVGMVNTINTTRVTTFMPSLISALFVFVLSMVLCAFFLRMARQRDTVKRGKVKVRVPRSGTDSHGRGALRFARISAKRNKGRGLIVCVCSAVLCVLLLLLDGVTAGWKQELQNVYENSTVSGQAVSTNGQYYSDLVLPLSVPRYLSQLDNIESISVSKSWRYWFADDKPQFGAGSFSQEHEADWKDSQSEIVALNRMEAAKEFYYTSVEFEWLDGWDESFLSSDEYGSFTSALFGKASKKWYGTEAEDTYPCVVSRNFLEKRGLQLGDTASVFVMEDTEKIEILVNIMPVGTFASIGGKDYIYVPLSFYISPELLTGEAQDYSSARSVYANRYANAESYMKYLTGCATFSTMRFRLSSARNLDATREALWKKGFSTVGRLNSIRSTILLRDKSFKETTETLNRFITLSGIVFPVVLLAVAVLGFVISWLMVNGRKQEFAIMRGLGAGKHRVFKSFFTEQAVLSFLGGALAFGAMLLLRRADYTQWYIAVCYIASYFVGCAVSIKSIGKMKLMDLLAERE